MCQVCHDGRCARAGAAAHTGGDEHHVGALQHLGQCRTALLSGLLADFGLGAGAHAVGQLFANLNLILADGFIQVLLIGIDGDELHTVHAGFNHTVNNVVAGTADANHLDFNNALL